MILVLEEAGSQIVLYDQYIIKVVTFSQLFGSMLAHLVRNGNHAMLYLVIKAFIRSPLSGVLLGTMTEVTRKGTSVW